MGIVKVNLDYIKKILSTKNGSEFENIASFILSICDRRYTPTRSSGDGGIDGIKYVSKNEIECYAIYGPQKLNWSNKDRKKVDDEIENLKNFLATIPEKKLKKWFFIINFELSIQQVHYIKSKLSNPNLVEIITPQKLIAMIAMKDEYGMAVARFLDLLVYDIPLEILSTNEILKTICVQIGDLEQLDTIKLKEERLNEIMNAILGRAYEGFEFKYGLEILKHKVRLELIIIHGTTINYSNRVHYIYFNKKFHQISSSDLLNDFSIKNKKLDRIFYSHDNNMIVFTPLNLFPLYELCLYLKNNLNSSLDISQLITNFLNMKANIELTLLHFIKSKQRSN